VIRRQALLGLAGLAVGGAIATGSAIVGGSDVEGVVEILHKRLSYLKLDIRGVRQFAHDCEARGLISARKLRVLSAAGALYERVPQAWFDFLAPDVPRGEERVVTMFLLSSDFFPSADEGRTVRYIGFFDAQLRVNPFARLRVPTV
jgi:hypothetical protein